MKVLVTGAGGMLARALVPELRSRGHEVSALDRAALDVTDERAVAERVLEERPGVVVQCAAYTAVDAAEEEEDLAFRVNAEAAGFVARACDQIGALFVYPSTDYVFRGNGMHPYRPGDPPDPVNAYGRSKLGGEVASREASRALVVRTSWLYGEGGKNFVDTISRLARERDRLEVVEDQVGRPTSTASLAWIICELIDSGAEGTFHATDGGEPVSWLGFAREIVSRLSLEIPVFPVSSATLRRAAVRPGYSVLDLSGTEAVIGRALPHWKEALARYLGSRGGGA